MIPGIDRLSLHDRLMADFSLMLGDSQDDVRFLANIYEDVLDDFFTRRRMAPAPQELGGLVMMRLARDGQYDMLQTIGTLHGRDSARMPVAEYLALHAVGHVHAMAPASLPHVAPDLKQTATRVETALSAVRGSVSRDGLAASMRDQAEKVEKRFPGIKAATGAAFDAVITRIDKHIATISAATDRLVSPIGDKIEAFGAWTDDIAATSRARFASFGKAIAATGRDFVGGLSRLFSRSRDTVMDAPDRIRAVARETVDATGDRLWMARNTAEQAKEDLRDQVKSFIDGLRDRRNEAMLTLSEKRYAVKGKVILTKSSVSDAIARARLVVAVKVQRLAGVIAPAASTVTAAMTDRLEPTLNALTRDQSIDAVETSPLADAPALIPANDMEGGTNETLGYSDVPAPENEAAVRLRFAFLEDAVLQGAEHPLSEGLAAWNSYVEQMPEQGEKMLMAEFVRDIIIHCKWYSQHSGYDFMDKLSNQADLYAAVYAHRLETEPETLAILTGAEHAVTADDAAVREDHETNRSQGQSWESVFHPVGLIVPDTFRDKLMARKQDFEQQKVLGFTP